MFARGSVYPSPALENELVSAAPAGRVRGAPRPPPGGAVTAWCPCPALTRPFRRALWGGRGPRGRAAPAPAARTGSGAPSAPPLPAVVWGPLRLCRVRSGGSSERSWAFICLPPPPSLEQVPVRVFLEERPPLRCGPGSVHMGGGPGAPAGALEATSWVPPPWGRGLRLRRPAGAWGTW